MIMIFPSSVAPKYDAAAAGFRALALPDDGAPLAHHFSNALRYLLAAMIFIDLCFIRYLSPRYWPRRMLRALSVLAASTRIHRHADIGDCRAEMAALK